MDLEGIARALYKNGKSKDMIIEELASISGDINKAEAILKEIISTENISDEFVKNISGFEISGISADLGGLGCRGEGDFFIHHKISELIENEDTIIDPKQQDDAGVVAVGEDYIAVSVDGMHSRLSHFPFLAGYHAARAAIRDVIVMGCEPKAIISDIHLGNDADVAKIFDYTSGIATVSELTKIPLVAGSTLRIGGDLVLGDRLTGCVGCVGFGRTITPRQCVQPGDLLIMTEGSGGGTIATTALYNGQSKIVRETLNLKFINLGLKLLHSDILSKIHALTDITNGGLRGDAFEIANSANVMIVIFEKAFKKLINSKVYNMLSNLDIDPLGVSIDSLLLIAPEGIAQDVLDLIHKNHQPAAIIGRVEECKNKNPGVSLINDIEPEQINVTSARELDGNSRDLEPEFREAPYTPIKKVVNIKPKNSLSIENAISKAVEKALLKKQRLKEWLIENERV